MAKPKKFLCVKCKKEKNEADGDFYMNGTRYCCKKCCGSKGVKSEKGKKSQICEFC